MQRSRIVENKIINTVEALLLGAGRPMKLSKLDQFLKLADFG